MPKLMVAGMVYLGCTLVNDVILFWFLREGKSPNRTRIKFMTSKLDIPAVPVIVAVSEKVGQNRASWRDLEQEHFLEWLAFAQQNVKNGLAEKMNALQLLSIVAFMEKDGGLVWECLEALFVAKSCGLTFKPWGTRTENAWSIASWYLTFPFQIVLRMQIQGIAWLAE
jgi:hypothetical protein